MSFFSLRRRTLYALLFVLGLFLVGTVVVLSSISYYLAIPDVSYVQETEVDKHYDLSWNETVNDTTHHKPERIPRIIHQTWKSETLPERWQNVSDGCRQLMPD